MLVRVEDLCCSYYKETIDELVLVVLNLIYTRLVSNLFRVLWIEMGFWY